MKDDCNCHQQALVAAATAHDQGCLMAIIFILLFGGGFHFSGFSFEGLFWIVAIPLTLWIVVKIFKTIFRLARWLSSFRLPTIRLKFTK